ncbi:hypothetical protein ACTPED_20335, partial [Clostridioides difficile]|uniref:hypothetical protein n=1 Tax=Clostridioides difficile TaxID=1496 RepID=UPI003F8D36B7
KMLREGTIDREQQVKMWVLPHGVICDLVRVGGMDILRNGTYDAVNSFLARELAEAGLQGEVLFYTTRVIPQTLSKWLTYWLSSDPDASDPELSSVTITVWKDGGIESRHVFLIRYTTDFPPRNHCEFRGGKDLREYLHSNRNRKAGVCKNVFTQRLLYFRWVFSCASVNDNRHWNNQC